MIIEALINLITVVIKLIAIPFNVLPDTPEVLRTTVTSYMDMIFGNTDTLHQVAIIAIAIYTLDKAFNLLMFIIRKLPLSIN